MAIPAWQTDDLGEEWVESSPSPPPSLRAAPTSTTTTVATETLPRADPASIRAKRGSLRALGHAAARSLPPPRSATSPQTNSPRIVSGHGEGRVLSEKINTNRPADLPSPPDSGASDAEKAEAQALGGAGTFVVKDGVDDDRGKHLARKGRDMFGPTALEKMFRPPSPVPESPSPVASDPAPLPDTPSPHPTSTSSVNSSDIASLRKASNPYAPTHPSRLSKSMTPSTVSSSFSATLPHDPDQTHDISVTVEEERSSLIEEVLDEVTRELKSGEVETDLSLPRPGQNYPFTFTQAVPATTRSCSPSLSPFEPENASHSTMHHGSIKTKPGLRLFRSGYDTYTREHLSALVDSIAADSSPSPPHHSTHARQWSSLSPQSEDSAGGSSASRMSDRTDDSRSSKRMRMSPSSPARRPPGVRDWAAEGRALMDRIRDANHSTASEANFDEEEQAQPSSSRSPSPEPLTEKALRGNQPTHRSNPSTTSSTYLRRAEELMEAIRARNTSESASARDYTNSASASSDDWNLAEIVHQAEKAKAAKARAGGGSVSPPVCDDRALGDSATASSRATSSDWDLADIVQRAREANAAKENAATGHREAASPRRRRRPSNEGMARQPLRGEDPARPKARLEERRPTSAGSSLDRPSTTTGTRVEQDDFNRFVSATTAATSTTISTSFVKHAGPRQGGAAIRVIKPDEVAGILPDRVGKMRYDKTSMRWVREREPLSGIEEAAEGSTARSGSGADSRGTAGSRGQRSRSEESEDPFAGMDSWGRDSNPNVNSAPAQSAQGQTMSPQPMDDDRTDSEEDDENVIRHADTTHILDHSDSECSSSDQNDHVDAVEPRMDRASAPPQAAPSAAASTTPARPVPHHASSAPAIMTPRNNLALQPIRSALRNANSATPGLPSVKKQQQWHASVTPLPDSAPRRSVSFSDGRDSGRMRDCHPDETIETVDSEDPQARPSDGGDEEWFRAGEGSWMPSMRTQKIDKMLAGMNGLSLDEGTPSKAPGHVFDSLIESPAQIEGDTEELHDVDVDADRTIRGDTVRPRSRASRRQDTNATFLTECSFGVTRDRLIQLITDVYGSEPYWEHLTQLDLRSKEVDSVTRLKEFLPELVEVNLNDNKVSYLSGIPSGVKTLHISRNRLTSMSSLDHLRNLTHLDISHNNLDSVTQLGCLARLVDLNLDDNLVKDISGIRGLSNLVTLSAKNNKLGRVDFTSTNWPNLSKLELSGNRITRIEGLDNLTSLRDLDLDNNRLSEIRLAEPLLSLRTLRISDNDLDTFDVSFFPKMRTLWADRNDLLALSFANGYKNRLENLSLRNQAQPGLSLDWTALASLKRLYLSGTLGLRAVGHLADHTGNPLSGDFFVDGGLDRLQYLEAAACSLSTWPTGFASALPHVEILNLNYNYLHDLDGLKGIRSLRKVSVVGARLGGEGGKAVMRGLRGLVSLEEVDLRMNPSTLGFYLPLILPADSTSLPNLDLPPIPSNPLPNVTLATARPPDTPAPAHAHLNRRSAPQPLGNSDWSKLDAQFRKSLPDEWYSKRLVYRGLIMGSLPRLRVLDGVLVLEGERKKASELLALAAGSRY